MAQGIHVVKQGFSRKRKSDMLALLLLLLPVAFFYWYTLHEVAPWFDELYTYQYFISRGPRYTMTHWPLPNNHVLFNALSSLVAKLGVDKILVLRGVSLCSVLASTSLVFLWLRSCFGRLTGIMGALAFAFGSCAEAQGVQGRGYSLSMLLFLLALIASFYLIREGIKARWLVLWVLAISLGVYAIPSNIYWVLALAAGTVLQLRKSLRDEFTFLGACVAGGLLAFCLYAPIWFTTAAEAGHAAGPLESLRYGISSMLADKYIQGQGVTRAEFLSGFWVWFAEVGDVMWYGGGAISFLGIMGLIAVCAALVYLLRRRFATTHRASAFAERQEETPDAISDDKMSAEELDDAKTILTQCIVCLIGMLVISAVICSFPFCRIFTYFGVVVAVCLALFMHLVNNATRSNARPAFYAALGLSTCLLLGSFFSYQSTGFFTIQDSERSLKYIFEEVLVNRKTDKILFADVCPSCHGFFNWGISYENANENLDTLELVIVENNQLVPTQEQKIWSNRYLHSELPWDFINSEMSILYRDAEYAVYVRDH